MISMPHTVITPDKDAVISEIDIAAPPERVFRAITDPEEVRRRSPELDFFEMDTRVGGRWSFEMSQPYKGIKIRSCGPLSVGSRRRRRQGLMSS
jgi:uncharacterized protein YndB with AHSA1/START domain